MSALPPPDRVQEHQSAKVVLASHGVTIQSPDAFLTDLHAAFPDALISSVKQARHNLRKTMPSVDTFIDGLQQGGLKTLPALLRQSIDAQI
jgi:hypothetical protein